MQRNRSTKIQQCAVSIKRVWTMWAWFVAPPKRLFYVQNCSLISLKLCVHLDSSTFKQKACYRYNQTTKTINNTMSKQCHSGRVYLVCINTFTDTISLIRWHKARDLWIYSETQCVFLLLQPTQFKVERVGHLSIFSSTELL